MPDSSRTSHIAMNFKSIFLHGLASLLAIFVGLHATCADTFFNPIISNGADPWMIYKDGLYYYTHTTGASVKLRKAPKITGTGGIGSASENTIFTPPAPFNKNVWAPELHFLQGKWYIYYAADDGNNANHRMFVAESLLPDGPYTFLGKIFDTNTDRWAIDGTVLEKNDGSLYFIWSGWPGATDGLQNTYIAPMSNPWTISGPRVLISSPSLSWEGWIQEGQQILKRNGKIFLIYSANASWTDDYALGMLTNTDGNVLNPASWTKHPTPVFKKYSDANGGVYGPGHGSFTKSLDQTEDWIIYHAAKSSGSGWDRNIRAQKFTWNPDDSPNFGNPIPTSVPVTVPSGEGTPQPPGGSYTLTVNISGDGSVQKNPDQPSYAANSTVTLTATANDGQFFSGWSGDAGGTNNPLSVVMDRNKTITANFTNVIILDNGDAAYTGSWTLASSATDKFGADYHYASTASTVTRTATYTPNIVVPGKYDVYVWYPQGGNRSASAPYLISHDGGNVTAFVNQQINGGGWRLIASGKRFAQGTSGFIRLSNNTGESGKLIMADGVRLVYSASQDLPPTITQQPQSQTVIAGSNVTFYVTATGSPTLTYQWRQDGAVIPGATASSYTRNNVQPSHAGNYTVVVQNSFGSATSSEATLTVNVPPSITQQPQSQTVNRGENVTFNVTVTGSAPFGYQWRKNGSNISGANQASYTVNNVETTDAGDFSVVVSNGAGSITSSNATLTVNIIPGGTSPTITRHPESKTVVQGNTVQFSVEASGASPMSYQWRFNGTNISGATGNIYTLNNAQPANEGGYSVIASNPFGSATSSTATLTVTIPPIISAHPQSHEVTQGTTVLFSVTANGTQPLSYQWNFNGEPVTGATGSSLTRLNVQSDDAGIYTVTVTNVAGTVISSNASLIVNVPPSITTQPLSQNINLGQSVNFTVSATGTAPLSYQWFFNGNPLPDATNGFYFIGSVESGNAGNYSVTISNVAGSANSSAATLAINFPPTITTHPSSQIRASGSTVNFSAEATGTAPIGFRWHKNGTPLNDGGNISGAQTATLTLSDAAMGDSGDYTVLATNMAGFDVSQTATLTVLDVPVILTQPSSQNADAGTEVTFTVSAEGSEPLSYQWFFNDAEILGAEASSYTIPNVQPSHAGLYSVRVSNAVGTATSSGATLSVNTDFILPTVKILAPANNFKTTASSLTVTGTASDDREVREVLISLNGATFAPATGTTNWSATLSLSAGTNVVEVKSVNLAGNESVPAYRTFFYSTFSLLTLQVTGEGYVTGLAKNSVLEVGKGYKATALVGAGTNSVFTNWTDASGAVIDSTNVLVFVMQSNLVLNANFIPNPFVPASGVYNGLFYETNGIQHHSAGFVTLKVNSKKSFSGKLLVDGNSVSMSGKFSLPGTVTRTVSRAKFGKPDLTVTLALDFAGGSEQATGTVSEPEWESPLIADRWIWTTNNEAPFTNSYTFLVPGFSNAAEGPPGSGFGAVAINALGKIKLAGIAADAVALKQSTMVSKNGLWPLYAPMYVLSKTVTNGLTVKTNKEFQGAVMGWLSFTNSAPAGELSWIKQAWTNALYSSGFIHQAPVFGSVYTPPLPGIPALQLTNGTLTVVEGNLSASYTNSLFLSTNNAFTFVSTNLGGLKISLSKKTGVFKGSFFHPDAANRVTPFSGALLQNQNRGGGFFLGTNQAGKIYLE